MPRFDIGDKRRASLKFVIVSAAQGDLLAGSASIEIHDGDAAGGAVVVDIALRDGDR